MLEFMIFGVFPGLVVLAATMDMFTMTIPNRLCLALAGSFFIGAFLVGLPIETVLWHIVAGLIALSITFVLFTTGMFGGGDAKLTAAIVLWLGPALAVDFTLLAALFGGVLTISIVLVRAFRAYTVVINSPWVVRLVWSDVGIPYGIALSAAAMVVFANSPWFLTAIAS